MKVPALQVRQWLKTWDLTHTDKAAHAAPPEHQFYLFTMPAGMLARLCHVHRRGGDDDSAERINPLAIQRHLNKERTAEIKNFIERGYPWSELSQRKQKSDQYDALVRPGWLPTALVVNILKKGEKRQNVKLDDDDVIDIVKSGDQAVIDVPDAATKLNWKPQGLAPMEVIDGQHRLKALEAATAGETYDLPVVAFHGLDISWQAYLFYTINIKPKKLNASLAFDLFPLLRSQEWLETGGELKVYRETRAQELVEVLASHPQSPWYKHINMLGASGKPTMVSQAAWIRTLLGTVLKTPKIRKGTVGGLYTSNLCRKEPLPWTRAQQAAYILEAGALLRDEVLAHKGEWAKTLRAEAKARGETEPDPAFYGRFTLLSGDQGIGGFIETLNDISVQLVDTVGLCDWSLVEDDEVVHMDNVTAALKDLRKRKAAKPLKDLARTLAGSDWRSFAFEDLDEEERQFKAGLRGGGGYKQLQKRLLTELRESGGEVGKAAEDVLGGMKDG